MEETSLLTPGNLAIICAVLCVLLVIALAMVFRLRSRLGTLERKYAFFTQGRDMDIESVLTEALGQARQAEADMRAVEKEQEKMQQQIDGCLQKVKLVRYDAFDTMGGAMSYSLLLTDAQDNGFILTSIYGREDNRCYCKDLAAGKSSYVLSDEEKRLLGL